jgi:uncharacterized protein YcbK (DUF882 family)
MAPCEPIFSRRRFLKSAAIIPAMELIPSTGLAESFWNLPRSLRLIRAQTGERVDAVYWADGQLVPDGYEQICRILRDVRADRAVQMDVVMLDILRAVIGWFDAAEFRCDIHVTSGYRTAGTNEMTEGAAQNSLHPRGKACDIFIPNIPVEYLGRLGLYFAGGGVGFYLAKRFVHLDCGKVRSWNG